MTNGAHYSATKEEQKASLLLCAWSGNSFSVKALLFALFFFFCSSSPLQSVVVFLQTIPFGTRSDECSFTSHNAPLLLPRPLPLEATKGAYKQRVFSRNRIIVE